MAEKTVCAECLEHKKEDAAELISILNRVPTDRKKEVLGIVKGYALCAENEAGSRNNPAQTGTNKP